MEVTINMLAVGLTTGILTALQFTVTPGVSSRGKVLMAFVIAMVCTFVAESLGEAPLPADAKGWLRVGVSGLVVGLAAMGLWSGGKNTIEKKES